MFCTQRHCSARIAVVQRLLALAFLVNLLTPLTRAQNLGLLEGHTDIGTVLHPGSTLFDPAQGTYTVTGSGDNLWFTADDMQFAWKRVHGDVALTAQIDFIGEKGNNHRKAALMMRQSLAPGSPYADVARHGDGLTSLQFRLTAGDVTREVETAAKAPHWVRIERRGNLVSVEVGDSLESLRFSGATIRLQLADDFYVGLAVCSHDKSVTETAVFRHLQITPLPATAGDRRLWSTLETVKVASSDRRIAYTAPARLMSPDWSRDGNAITFVQSGTLRRFALDPAPYPSFSAETALNRQPTPVSTGTTVALSGTQGSSPDGTQIAFSAGATSKPQLYVVGQSGGAARELPTSEPAEWHSWSPDGQRLAFDGENGGRTQIYTVAAQGGQEKLLTANEVARDPDFSPDGQWIYYSSRRSGHLQLWRMHPDGNGSEQVLSEPINDANPHPSPDGKYVVYLALPDSTPGTEQMAELRLFSLSDHTSHLLATLLAGPGTLPVPSWSPDSTRVAFISYAYLP